MRNGIENEIKIDSKVKIIKNRKSICKVDNLIGQIGTVITELSKKSNDYLVQIQKDRYKFYSEDELQLV